MGYQQMPTAENQQIKPHLSSKMFKIAVCIVTTLALAQQSYGLSKCYAGGQTSEGKSQLSETDCSTDCVRTAIYDPSDDAKWVATMHCDGLEGPQVCSSRKDKCVDINAGLVKSTVCCCSSDLCNGVGVSGLSGALAMALVAAIFWGQN